MVSINGSTSACISMQAAPSLLEYPARIALTTNSLGTPVSFNAPPKAVNTYAISFPLPCILVATSSPIDSIPGSGSVDLLPKSSTLIIGLFFFVFHFIVLYFLVLLLLLLTYRY